MFRQVAFFTSIWLLVLGLLFFNFYAISAELNVSNFELESEEYFMISHGVQPKSFFDLAKGAVDLNCNFEAMSAISAHHLVVADKMYETFSCLKESKTVVILSTDHFGSGNFVISGKVRYSTPFGVMEADAGLVEDLLGHGFIREDLRLLSREHGIASLTPFLKDLYPDMKIVPVVVGENIDDVSKGELIDWLLSLPENVAVVASIDMSHNLPLLVQEFHDDITLDALKSGERRHDLEIDANQVLDVIQAYNKARGLQNFELIHRNSSVGMGFASDWRENTSHILGVFTEGQAEVIESANFHFVGDIMLDRGARLKMNEFGVDYPWREMERYLRGVDLRIGNLEGTVNEQESTYTYNPPFRFVFSPESIEAMLPFVDVVSLANNHSADVGARAGQEETRKWLDEFDLSWFGAWETPDPAYDFEIGDRQFRLIGYHEFRPNVEDLLGLIEEGETAGRFVIVMPHWGVEYNNYPSSNQMYLSELMVEAGADLIIGGHPHVVQGVHVIEDVPVVYSLGNFVFDQEIPVTWDAMTLGVRVFDDRIMLYFLPIGTRYSQPVPLAGFDAKRVLEIVSENSDEAIYEDILEGKLTIFYAKP